MTPWLRLAGLGLGCAWAGAAAGPEPRPCRFPLGEAVSFEGNLTGTSATVVERTEAWLASTDFEACPQYALSLPGTLAARALPPRGAVLALQFGHDASVAIGIDGRVQCAIELERFVGKRYYRPGAGTFEKEWLHGLRGVRDFCECEAGECPGRFDVGVIVNFGTDFESEPGVRSLPAIAEKVFEVDEWRNVHHHVAHALLGYHASPFRSALVISYDGGGNDGSFESFLGSGHELYRIESRRLNYGVAYAYLARFMPEITGVPLDLMCRGLMKGDPIEHLDRVAVKILYRFFEKFLSDAGTLMGYAAVGKWRADISAPVRNFLQFVAKGGMTRRSLELVPKEILLVACESTQGQRDLAATIQFEFERLVHGEISNILDQVLATRDVEGLVITGGCALNVLMNQRIRDQLTSAKALATDAPLHSRRLPLDIYVPPAPNDGGLVVGGLWAVTPPVMRQPLQYVGARLWDMSTLEAEARRRGARRLADLGGVEYLASLLAGGLAWGLESNRSDKPIIAVVRGRQEFGPRALGHRSLLAVPDSVDMRKRMNRLKVRQWYRPVAPMIADEALVQVFGDSVSSVSMEMAPLVTQRVQRDFPAMTHLDGTARHQSVGQKDEPWLHALLLAVGRHTGLAALINTSFNSKGKPITNTVKECLHMLDRLQDLDFVVIEDWLFKSKRASKYAVKA